MIFPSGMYGDGSDGSHTFDGSTTILGMVPSMNVYTLTRDIFLTSSTINNGVSIITSGCRIFCKGTLTNNGTIEYNGNNGLANGTAGALLTSSSWTITNAVGSAGGAGTTGNGGNGGSSGGLAVFGGAGATAGTGTGSAGSGGTATAFPTDTSPPRWFPEALIGRYLNTSGTYITFFGGTGGGGGGGDGATAGGGGGSGAGIIVIAAFAFSGTGTIETLGGNGGSPGAGVNTGGGAGGGGGVITIISSSISSGAISGQTISVLGGMGGSGFGLGGNGNPGGSGTTVLLYSL